MNMIVLQGKLVKRPEIRYPDGTVVTVFDIAVPKKFPKKNSKATADFFNCSAFGKNAENIYKYFDQGDTILIQGRLENDNYVNRSGEKVYRFVIIVEEWGFGPRKLNKEEMVPNRQG